MTYSEIIAEVANSLNLSQKFVDRVYRSYWKAIRSHITSLPLKDNLTDEEFLKLKPNINIPSIGKFYVSLNRYQRLKKQGEILKLRKHVEDKIN